MTLQCTAPIEDYKEKEISFQDYQRAMLNILEDFDEEKKRLEQSQRAFLNILEDSDKEKTWLEQSQRAFLNILEDIYLERVKLTNAYLQIEVINKELEEFAYIASHDLKAPLRVIDNASKWLEEDLQKYLTSETRENMNLLRGRVARMEKLLDDLLEYSRIGRTMDVRYAEIIAGDALMDNILTLLSPPKGFIVSVSPSFAVIHVRRMPLQQILMNLISNAIKHHDKKKGCITVTVEEGDMHYTFAVKDNGPGIPAQFHDQIFKMFQTLKPRDQVEGSGMGLAMARKNIEVFGGTLNLESSEGEGSLFYFTWPKQQIKGENV
ncbi:MAG: ATP-binding protein [Pseudomonadota bacterium]